MIRQANSLPFSCSPRFVSLFVWLGFVGLVGVGQEARGQDDSRPQLRVLDERLEISVFVEAPQIVTPTGIAVDADGNVLVIESHTHFPPDGYEGPKEDRIRRFRDNDGDGKADEMTEFYVGGVATMNLAVHPNGYVYVATRNEIFRLRDQDGDGKAEVRESLVQLETAGEYPHNGLSGFAFDFNGDVYFGMGENLGVDYTLIGQENIRLRGGGEGGNVFRIAADGSELQRVATGFWNPFHLCFDAYGRLFAVDNDPDSRPPCRLLHIVPGGDYGYRFRNGRKGTHPFTSWFGGNPGTLGLTAETGEAPSGVVAYESDGLPADYRGTLISGSWGNHTIEQFTPQPRGASFQAAGKPIIKGDKFFRPVGIAVAPDGSLLVSDWVDRSYKLHGKGRVWRIRSKSQKTTIHDKQPVNLRSPHLPARSEALRTLQRRGVDDVAERAANWKDPKHRAWLWATLTAENPEIATRLLEDPSPDVQALGVRLAKQAPPPTATEPLVLAAQLRRTDAHRQPQPLLKALESDDPFLRQAARLSLQRSAPTGQLLQWMEHPQAAVRRGAGLVLKNRLVGAEAAQAATALLKDPDPLTRFVGIQWAGEAQLKSLKPLLQDHLYRSQDSGRWIDAYLAALHLIDGGKAADFERQQLTLILNLLKTPDLSPLVRARIMRRIPASHEWWTRQRVDSHLRAPSAAIRLETVRTLYESADENQQAWLRAVTQRSREEATIRRAAVAGLDPAQPPSRVVLLQLATSDLHPLQRAALESLQAARLNTKETQRLQAAAERSELPAALFRRAADTDWKAERGWGETEPQRVAWLEESTGEAKRGERLFFHPRGAKCNRCHRINGRGGDIGPDLSAIHKMSPQRILHSILKPSDEIAPQYTPWRIELTDGTLYTGLLVTEKADDQVFANDQGETRVIKRQEIELRSPLSQSVMPDGLAERLTDQELRDLIAYLTAPK